MSGVFALMAFAGLPSIDDFNRCKLAIFPIGATKGDTPKWKGVQWFDNPSTLPASYGVAIPPHILVVDVDSYKPNAKGSFLQLCEDYDLPLDTFTVRTGRGGYHYWYRMGDPKKVTKNPERYPDIDFLSHGNYVVGPGSWINDNQYIVQTGELGGFASAPQKLIDDIERFDKPLTAHNVGAKDIDAYKSFLEGAPLAVRGSNSNDMAFKTIAAARDYGLSEVETLECIQEWNRRCEQPWTVDDLIGKIKQAYKYGKNEIGAKVITAEEFTPIEEDIGERLLLDGNIVDPETNNPLEWDSLPNGRLKPSLNNLRLLLKWMTIDQNGEDYIFRDMFRFDEYRQRIEIVKTPFWRKDAKRGPWFLADSDVNAIRFYIAGAKRVDFTRDVINDAIAMEAYRRTTHPLRNWLAGLEWDGVPRAEKLFLEYFNHKEDDETLHYYRRKTARSFLLASVWRAFNPGQKWDYCMILAGPQGVGKSMFVQILGGEFSRTILHLKVDKDNMMATAGAWWIELPELSSMRKTDVDSIKAYISTTVDTYRRPYDRNIVEVPRGSVFVWTVNPIEGQGILRDTTGNRRFYIVKVDKMIDFEAIQRDREQIFAEVMTWFRDGQLPHAQLPIATAAKVSEELTEDDYDTWQDALTGLDESKAYTYSDVFEILGIYDPVKRDQREKRRVHRVMVKLGWYTRRTAQTRYFTKTLDIAIPNEKLQNVEETVDFCENPDNNTRTLKQNTIVRNWLDEI